jgi:hypothetical protein
MDQEQEQEQHNECWYCHEEMVAEQPRSELPCHHFLHTTCFVHIVHFHTWNACGLCHQIFDQNHNDVFQEPAATETSRIEQLYTTDPRFKEAAKRLVKQKSMVTRTRNKMVKLVKQKKAEVRERLLVIQAQLEGITSLKKDEIQESQEYKDFMKAKRGYTMIGNRLREEFNCTPREIGRALREKPGFKRFNPRGERWFHSAYNMFQRPWRYRVPV